ncbi:cytochrome c oxidase assembly factor CtaG [Bacillaceae bacterium]
MLGQIFDSFGFRAMWNPGLLLITLILAIAYLLIVGPFRKNFKHAAPVPFRKKLFFVLGLFAFYLGFGGPLYLLGHLLFTVHMLQMAVLFLAGPLLLLLGTPEWFIKPLLNIQTVNKTVRLITNPILSMLLFNGFFSFYHLPVVFDYLMTNYSLHVLYLMFLFLLAFIMWWPIVNPVNELDRLSELKKLGMIVGNGILITPACALIIFANEAIYATYTDPQTWSTALGYCLPSGTEVSDDFYRFFGLMPPLRDQQLGGVIMKITQELIYGIVLAQVFFRWVKKVKKEELNAT